MSASLAALQQRFHEALHDESAPGPRGIEVYRRSGFANRHAAMAAAFPVVQRLVGAAFFAEAVRRFVRVAACGEADLQELGRGFAEFLDDYGPAASLPYLADVARLEWAIDECVRAADAPPASFAALARLDPRAYASLRVDLHPAARRVASHHPVLAIWEANQPSRDGTPARLQGPDRVLVCREAGRARPMSLHEREWRLLGSLADGQTLEAAAEPFEDDAQAFSKALARLALAGAFAAFRAGEQGVSPVA